MAITYHFDDHFFPLIHVSANPKFRKESKTSDEDFEITITPTIACLATPNTKDRYFSELRLKIDPEDTQKIPYFIDIVCACFIQIEGATSEEEAKSKALELAHKMLFPAIREMLLNLTARQPWGQFSIGLTTLNDMLTEEDYAPPPPAPKKPRSRKPKAPA